MAQFGRAQRLGVRDSLDGGEDDTPLTTQRDPSHRDL